VQCTGHTDSACVLAEGVRIEFEIATHQGRTGPPDNLVLAKWASWSAGQMGRQSNGEGESGTDKWAQRPIAIGGRASLG